MSESRIKPNHESRKVNTVALLELFKIFEGKLLKCIRANLDRRLQSRIDATDILQNTFLALFNKLPDFEARRNDYPMSAWIFLEAKQQVAQAHRRHLGTKKRDSRVERGLDPEMETSKLDSGVQSPVLSDVIRRETKVIVLREMEDLAPRDFEVIWMRCFDGLSTRETASRLGVSKSTASKRFVQASMKLKTKLASAAN